MHKSLYKFAKKRNKCDVTIKSKITINGKKVVETIKKFTKKETKLERESIDLFAMNNLEGMWERDRNELKRNL